jgi:hypothetical protein
MKRLSSTNQNSTSLTNVPDPTNPQDAATKNYVDANVGAGDVVGPSSSVDNTLVIFDSTTGKLLKSTGGTSSSAPITYGLDTTGILQPATGAGSGQQIGMVGGSAGTSSSGGGAATLIGGTAGATSGNGGDVNIHGGYASGGIGGDVFIYGGGTSSGTVGNLILGNPGNVQIQKNGTAFNLTLDVTGLSASRVITFPNYAGTIATLAGSEALTNKTISGASNTLSAIDNASLTNSSVTIGSTSVALGATATTLAGLTLTSPTLTTPALGVATATSINKVTVTQPATGSTLTIADGGTLATSGAFTFTATIAANANVTFPAGAYTAATVTTTQTLTGKTITGLVLTAGSTTVAPLRFSGVGALLTTPIVNTVEWDGTNLYFTNTGPTRRTVVSTDQTQTLTNKTLTTPVVDQFGTASGLGSAWGSYTPTLGNITLGTGGTNVGAYKQIGKTVHFRVTITLGTSPTMGTAPTFTLPVAPTGMTANVGWMTGHMYDVSATQAYPLLSVFVSGSTMLLKSINASFGQALDDTIAATVPFTWAAGDIIQIGGAYEAA